jgi:hypothetical protein
MAVKGYLVSVFTIFLHVVTIQLASAFLTLPEQTDNSLISIAVAIGLLFTLLKMPSFLMQMVFFSRSVGTVKRMGSQIINVMSADSATGSDSAGKVARSVKTARKTVNL